MAKILYAASVMEHINNFHLDYIEALRKDGHQVKVMASGDGADYDIGFVKKMLSFKNTACRRKIRKILKAEKFDVLILNTSLAAFHIRLCLRRKKRPRVINIVHGYLFSGHVDSFKRKVLLFCEKLMRSRTDEIVVMNGEDEETARIHRLCKNPPIRINGMGAEIAPEKIPVDKIREHMKCPDKYVLLFVGELSPRKNQRFLICALAEIKIHIPNAVLWLVGSGEMLDELKELCETMGLSNSVFFAGSRDNPCDFIRAADLYVSASEIEGMPFNIIEALGCKKTVLASKVKGHTDLIEDRKSGFFYDFGNEDEYVDKVCLIHSGVMKLDENEIYARYKNYSKDNVFGETYLAIKEALKNE